MRRVTLFKVAITGARMGLRTPAGALGKDAGDERRGAHQGPGCDPWVPANSMDDAAVAGNRNPHARVPS